jgi:hypothetical protein
MKSLWISFEATKAKLILLGAVFSFGLADLAKANTPIPVATRYDFSFITRSNLAFEGFFYLPNNLGTSGTNSSGINLGSQPVDPPGSYVWFGGDLSFQGNTGTGWQEPPSGLTAGEFSNIVVRDWASSPTGFFRFIVTVNGISYTVRLNGDIGTNPSENSADWLTYTVGQTFSSVDILNANTTPTAPLGYDLRMESVQANVLVPEIDVARLPQAALILFALALLFYRYGRRPKPSSLTSSGSFASALSD